MPEPKNLTPEYLVAGVVLLRDDRAALMQLRDNKPGLSSAGLWVFPGGHCEAQEELAVCARREFLEETGYDCAQLHWLASVMHRTGDTGRLYQLNFFWDRYDGIQPVSCFEGQEIRFVGRQEVVGLAIEGYVTGVWDGALEAAGLGVAKK